MLTIMFWNINRKDIFDEIRDACLEHSVDLLVLAECEAPIWQVIKHLNSNSSSHVYGEARGGVSQLKLFTTLPDNCITPIFDDGRVAIRRVAPPIGRELLLVAAHLPSKLHADADDQYLKARDVRSEITGAESQVGHKQTLVIGDLNMNPFEKGMASVDGFHAVMDVRVAMRGSRTVHGKPYDYFYNPMWSRLGDHSPGPSGTYYHPGAGAVAYYWNTFDQVLLRPELLPCFNPTALNVLTEIGGRPLLNGERISSSASDHLPIVIKLDLEK